MTELLTVIIMTLVINIMRSEVGKKKCGPVYTSCCLVQVTADGSLICYIRWLFNAGFTGFSPLLDHILYILQAYKGQCLLVMEHANTCLA